MVTSSSSQKGVFRILDSWPSELFLSQSSTADHHLRTVPSDTVDPCGSKRSMGLTDEGCCDGSLRRIVTACDLPKNQSRSEVRQRRNKP